MTKLARKSIPHKTLEAATRAEALALVRLGCSRRMAAARLGCAHTTIGRAAARDPQFAAALAEAESRPDREFRELVRHADRRKRRCEEERRAETNLGPCADSLPMRSSKSSWRSSSTHGRRLGERT